MGREKLINELRDALSETRAHLDAIDYKNRDVYIFGAGNTAKLHQTCFKTENIQPLAYLDNNKAGSKLNGIDIIAPADVANKDNALVLICSPQPTVNEFAAKQLSSLGIESMNLGRYLFALNLDEIERNINSFDDKESADIYATVLGVRAFHENNLTWGGG